MKTNFYRLYLLLIRKHMYECTIYVWHTQNFPLEKFPCKIVSKQKRIERWKKRTKHQRHWNERAMLSCNLSPLYHHSLSLSLSALSYAPLGTRRRDDTKENGVKTLPNCCYCFCFVLCCFSLIFASKTFCPTGTGRGRERKRGRFDSSAADYLYFCSFFH